MKKKNYQDYVIKNGKFIGEFEKCYQDFKDPWHHLNKIVPLMLHLNVALE